MPINNPRQRLGLVRTPLVRRTTLAGRNGTGAPSSAGRSFICEPVLTETSFPIHRSGGSSADLVRRLGEEALEVAIDLEEEAASVEALLRRYTHAPISLADTCFVRLTERDPDRRLFTLDSAFQHYRRNGRQLIPLIFPD